MVVGSKTQPHHDAMRILHRRGESTVILFLSHLSRSDVKLFVLNIKYLRRASVWIAFKHNNTLKRFRLPSNELIRSV